MYTHKRCISIACALVMIVTSSAYAQITAIKPAVCSVVGEHSSGEKSADVSAIQSFLVSRGYALPQSGEFDAATVAALKQFQTLYTADIVTMQGLTSAPGVWDIYTAMKARELVCGAAVIPAPAVTTVPTSTPNTTPVATTSAPTPVSAGIMPLPTQPTGSVIPERSAFIPDGSNTLANPNQTPAQTSQRALSSTIVPEPVVCLSFDIEPGTKQSDDVKAIQRWLMSQGYNKVEATGTYGTYTKRAIAHFQNEYAVDILVPARLAKATGVWGERTAKKASELGLCEYDADTNTASTPSTGGATTSGGSVPERSAYTPSAALNAAVVPTVPIAAPATSSVSTPVLAAPSTSIETVPTGSTVVPVARPAVDPAVVAAEAARLEEVYPGVCLPKTIGPIGTSDAKTNVLTEVKMLQRFLIARGYTKVEATGYYGPTTQRAVAHFQEENARDILEPAGLVKPTGVWGLRTAIKASELGLCEYK